MFTSVVKRIMVYYKVSMKLSDEMPVFFKISVNGLDIPSSRSRGSGNNFYMTMVGIGV